MGTWSWQACVHSMSQCACQCQNSSKQAILYLDTGNTTWQNYSRLAVIRTCTIWGPSWWLLFIYWFTMVNQKIHVQRSWKVPLDAHPGPWMPLLALHAFRALRSQVSCWVWLGFRHPGFDPDGFWQEPTHQTLPMNIGDSSLGETLAKFRTPSS